MTEPVLRTQEAAELLAQAKTLTPSQFEQLVELTNDSGVIEPDWVLHKLLESLRHSDSRIDPLCSAALAEMGPIPGLPAQEQWSVLGPWLATLSADSIADKDRRFLLAPWMAVTGPTDTPGSGGAVESRASMKHREFILGVDLDGVCADYETGLRGFVTSGWGVEEAVLPPQTRWSFVESNWFNDEQSYRDWHDRAVNDGLLARLPMIDGAAESLRSLSDAGVRIRIITHRLLRSGFHRQVVADTVGWLDAHDIPYWDLCFVADKTAVGCDLLVDDAPHNVAALVAAGRPVIIFDQPYNRDIPGPRATSWSQVERLARKAARL